MSTRQTGKDPAAIDPRRGARLAAVQALYQIALTGADPSIVISEFIRHRLGKAIEEGGVPESDPQLFSDIVRGASATSGELDDMIAAVLDPDWSVERLELLLLAVLRAGTYEVSARPDLPARVAISEYVAISAAFLGDRETGLVNGILDRIARSLRPDELGGDARGQRETTG
ncbi:MAG TPA: transcription antitermination factor NusB [Hypericibacter adhaerens]|jgi:N utilization substance protein B|uniref:transcription antitermination factor NusB n=1 Tax=Hypericibacter adhaerens TaxID=2602016 RepID=UPI002CDC20E1|nr:transcription antitermination factor NusB [Hypericibacter adhaerens]HWA42895.1 transcription antitermination factor NusB [Hypericibacter adhaerens]